MLPLRVEKDMSLALRPPSTVALKVWMVLPVAVEKKRFWAIRLRVTCMSLLTFRRGVVMSTRLLESMVVMGAWIPTADVPVICTVPVLMVTVLVVSESAPLIVLILRTLFWTSMTDLMSPTREEIMVEMSLTELLVAKAPRLTGV